MIYLELWSVVGRSLQRAESFVITSREVAGLVGVEQASAAEILVLAKERLNSSVRLEFKKVLNDYSWELHFIKARRREPELEWTARR